MHHIATHPSRPELCLSSCRNIGNVLTAQRQRRHSRHQSAATCPQTSASRSFMSTRMNRKRPMSFPSRAIRNITGFDGKLQVYCSPAPAGTSGNRDPEACRSRDRYVNVSRDAMSVVSRRMNAACISALPPARCTVPPMLAKTGAPIACRSPGSGSRGGSDASHDEKVGANSSRPRICELWQASVLCRDFSYRAPSHSVRLLTRWEIRYPMLCGTIRTQGATQQRRPIHSAFSLPANRIYRTSCPMPPPALLVASGTGTAHYPGRHCWRIRPRLLQSGFKPNSWHTQPVGERTWRKLQRFSRSMTKPKKPELHVSLSKFERSEKLPAIVRNHRMLLEDHPGPS